jgi:hypothetical protein
MFRITTVTEVNAVQASTEYADQRSCSEALRVLKASGLYSRICVFRMWTLWDEMTFTTEDLQAQRKLNKRIKEEQKVVKKIVESAIRLGFMVSVFDGEEYPVKRSVNKALILENTYTTDMDRLSFRVKTTGDAIGSVLLVYGNLASEVMADWTDNTNIEEILSDALAYCEKLAEKGE